MSVRRRQNWISQQRVDTVHIKSIESATSNDFDELLISLTIGEEQSYVVRGLKINMSGAIGASASGLQLLVADSAVLHGKSNESGTFLAIRSDATPETLNSIINQRISGAFSPGTINYVGLEFVRGVDDSTMGQIYIWNPANNNETTRTAPQALTLDYRIVITTGGFGTNVLPIATVQTDLGNSVLSVSDFRPLLNSLGRGGPNTPNLEYRYPWPEGLAPNSFTSTSPTLSPFEGGDKAIQNDKEWKDAVMTRFTDILGTPYWTSENAAGSLPSLRADLANTVFTSRGSITHDEDVAGRVTWTHNIKAIFIGGELKYTILANDASNDIILSDNDVAYIKIIRDAEIVPSLIYTNGSQAVTSVGAVNWTTGLMPGDFIKQANEGFDGYREILSVDSPSQVTLADAYDGPSTGPGGIPSRYALGVYQTSPTPNTDRHVRIAQRDQVEFEQDTFWLMVRQDNMGSLPRIYLRFSARELEQGETRQINDNTAQAVLDYTGMISESDSDPDYSNIITNLVAQQALVTLPAASSITSGQSWTISSSLTLKRYYVWYNKDSTGGDPRIFGMIPIEVPISTGQTQLDVADATTQAFASFSDFAATDNMNGTVTVTNSVGGETTEPENVDVGGIFDVTVTVQGNGAPNFVIIDEENLTRAIKRLDTSLGLVEHALEAPPYEEVLRVVDSSTTDPYEIEGPVPALTEVNIPQNSRGLIAQESFIVGDADLEISLNGTVLFPGNDYEEVGVAGEESSRVIFTMQLLPNDELKFRKIHGIGLTPGATLSGNINAATNLGFPEDADVYKQTVGSVLEFRRLRAGANMTIAQDGEKITLSASPGAALLNIVTVNGANHSLDASEDGILLSNQGSNRTVTLPDATLVPGKKYYIKKIDSGNALRIQSVLNQTLDGEDIQAMPHELTVQYQVITIVSVNGNWWVL
jgi:hypothetical protein